MSTLRLEQQDSYRTSFQSQVTGLETQGNSLWISLSKSLFYPTSGGQLFDTGSLNGVQVSDVIKQGDEVWHRVETSSFQLGQVVEGQIDWSRRYRHMQRHSAQHLLSQAFVRTDPQFETHSVSLRSPVCTIDFAGDPGAAQLATAETLANNTAYQALPIKAFEIAETELEQYALRRPPTVTGNIRLVQMGDFELSACGGTHLRSTAEALPIKILGLESIRNGLTRVRFVCGLKALQDYGFKHEVLTNLAQSFSSGFAEVPERVEALRCDLTEAQSRLKRVHGQLVTALAQNLLATAQQSPEGRVIAHVLEAEQTELLQPLSSSLTRNDDVIALLAASNEGRAQLLFARGKAVDVSMLELLQMALPEIVGRGGGKADRAQGGGDKPEGLQEALEAAAQGLKS